MKALPVFGCAGLSLFHFPFSLPTKGITMFFPFLASTIVGAGAVKLGAMSTMVSVLSLALQALILANLIGAGYFLWQRYGNKSDQQQ
jgi:hypothetical protein